MEIHVNDKYEIRERMWNRIENCILRLQELENMLLKDEITKHYYTEAREKIHVAHKLIEAFRNSPEDTEAEKQADEALESLEQYLNLGVFDELTSIIHRDNQEKRKLEEEIKKEDEGIEDVSEDEWINILHLSDLHFGIYTGTIDFVQNKREFFNVVERDLFPFLKAYIEAGHKIDIVVVTGDISYRNDKDGYYDFKDWLTRLCGEELLNVDIKSHVVMCPGNHDKNCDGKKRDRDGLLSKEKDDNKVAAILTIDKIKDWQDQFEFFNDICANLEMEPLTNFDIHTSMRAVPYVMGIKKVEDIYFVVLNSAWNSFPRDEKDGSDHGQLFLGQRPLKLMFEDAGISEEEMTVMLFHHPLAWLHEAEKRTYGKDQSKPSAALIKQYADMILNGHVHGGIEPPDILANKTVVFGGGTLYPDDSYLHQFEIISVNKTKHYCQQTVVSYDRQGENEDPFGWEITGGKYPPRIHYGIYRDIRDLITKYSLGEISMKEAERAAFERSAEMGLKAFYDLLEKTRYHQIKDKVRDMKSKERESDIREESVDRTKELTKDSGEGEKRS